MSPPHTPTAPRLPAEHQPRQAGHQPHGARGQTSSAGGAGRAWSRAAGGGGALGAEKETLPGENQQEPTLWSPGNRGEGSLEERRRKEGVMGGMIRMKAKEARLDKAGQRQETQRTR